jgi:hypothetical protein
VRRFAAFAAFVKRPSGACGRPWRVGVSGWA